MTADYVNSDVLVFVRSRWQIHRAVEVTATANENFTAFPPNNNNEARISFSTRGNLHHETGHLIIERLSCENRVEECTKEGICDAFKFLKMQQNGVSGYDLEDRDWFAKINRFMEQSIE